MCAAATPQNQSEQAAGGLARPAVSEKDAEAIARECYGISVTATELGSNQDRNYLLQEADGTLSVLRIDNPVFTDAERDGQHAALAAYREAGVPVASVLPGLDGALTQRFGEFAVRRSEFAAGEAMVHAGYFAPCVIAEFGALAAQSVQALQGVSHPGLTREHMWRMEAAYAETQRLAGAIADGETRERVLRFAAAANKLLEQVAAELPRQVIHGDLTDDNVMGVRGSDTRLHPQTVLDLGDISVSWRVAELAVTCASLLHHDPSTPLRVLDAVRAFHAEVPLSPAEARALWPLIVLRGTVLLASAHNQLAIDADNEYAKERIAGEEAIFRAATRFPVREGVEQVLAALDFAAPQEPAETLRDAWPLLQDYPVARVLDAGVESASMDAGAWLQEGIRESLIRAELQKGAAAVAVPYGVYRLWDTRINSAEESPTWPYETELWLQAGPANQCAAPLAGTVRAAREDSVTVELADGWLLRVRGITPAVHEKQELSAGELLGSVPEAEHLRGITVALLHPEFTEAADAGATGPGLARRIIPSRVPAVARLTADPAPLLGLPELAQHDTAAEELARRGKIFASAQERYYERPMQIERGWRHHLIDVTGRSYVDMVNNVSGLGHGHPGVAAAISKQVRVLNTNSRFLYRSLAEYSERLLALLPPDTGLDTVLLVNSGSEAVDLALRLAQAATGRKTVVALREAYHGWTMASDAVSTSAYDNPYALESRPEWIHVADVPNSYRGTYRGEDTGAAYARDLGADLARLEADGKPVAAFICESVLGNAGGVTLPDGYLADVYNRVRAAGGLCIADEVQVGFGRMGSTFWGFEQSGVVPDIIAIAKPMGNGFPIGGVITSKRVADALATQGQFFSSAGGNPLSCHVGLAVLDAMREERLQQNAHEVGEHLRGLLEGLREKHPEIVGPVHGYGLYLGLELVRDHETLEPAKEEAAAICERLRELGVVVLTTSERSNVLKIKPPLCLTRESAEFVVAQIDRVLTEGW